MAAILIQIDFKCLSVVDVTNDYILKVLLKVSFVIRDILLMDKSNAHKTLFLHLCRKVILIKHISAFYNFLLVQFHRTSQKNKCGLKLCKQKIGFTQ